MKLPEGLEEGTKQSICWPKKLESKWRVMVSPGSNAIDAAKEMPKPVGALANFE
jgi:hypothetical protein